MSDTTIKSVKGREIIDSRGNPTVEVDVTLEGEHLGVLRFLLEQAQANTKHGSFVMEIKLVILARASLRP